MVAAIALPSCVGRKSSERLLSGNTVQTIGGSQGPKTSINGGRSYCARHRLLHTEERRRLPRTRSPVPGAESQRTATAVLREALTAPRAASQSRTAQHSCMTGIFEGGCDYHPSFQQIAFVDTETGEVKEQRLVHREEAEKFYRALAGTGQRVCVGM